MPASYKFVLLFLPFLFACGNKFTENDLIGKWHVTNMKSELINISPMLIAEAEKEAKSSVYHLKENYELEMTSNFIDYGARGKWNLNTENNILTFNFNDSPYKSEEVYYIESLEGNELVLKQEVKELGTIKFTLSKEK